MIETGTLIRKEKGKAVSGLWPGVAFFLCVGFHDGRKTVTEHVMKCLTPLGLALWYMDDGTLAGKG